MLFPTRLSAFLVKAGPKHSTSVPFTVGFAVPLRVDVKEVAFVPNPVTALAEKAIPGPQLDVVPAVLCDSTHSLLPPTLQRVIPLLSPVTLHLKVKVSPGQVGGGPVSCPVTTPGEKNAWKHLPPPRVHNWMFNSVFYDGDDDLAHYNLVQV